MIFSPETPGHPPMVGIAITPDQQGKGFGAIAMVEAIQLLRNMGFSRIRLSVRLDNPRAKNLYESLGFTTVSRGTHTNFQGTYLSETMELHLENWNGTIIQGAVAS